MSNIDSLLAMSEQATKDQMEWMRKTVTGKYTKKEWQIYEHAYQSGWMKAVYAAKLHGMIKGVK